MRFTLRLTELGLLIMATLVFALTLISLELSQDNALTTDIFYLIGGFIGLFTLAHLALSFFAPLADQIILPTVAVLNGMGLIMLARLDLASGWELASRQEIWTLISIIFFVLVLFLLRDHRILTHYSYLLGAAGLILLALPLVWPQPAGAEARIWLALGPFSIQPGEFSKILLILFFAMLLTHKRALFTVAGYSLWKMTFPRLRDLAPILVIWGIAIIIMAISNDFGPALLLFSTVLGMVFIATGRVSWLVIGLMLVSIGAVGIYQISSKIQNRFSNFIDPLGNYDSGGYQLSQALFGMSSGGITGYGLGQGYPHIVPVAHSDFILAAIGEEFGLVGLAGVLILFAILISRGFHTALSIRDTYGKLVAAGLSLTLIIQIFVVTGGISALLPMTGLTTPFMSAGGSSLMANYILVAIILRISHVAHASSRESNTEAKPRRQNNE